MEYKDVYILAEEANTYDTPNRSIEAGIFIDGFVKGYKKGFENAIKWISVEDKLPEVYNGSLRELIDNDDLLVLFYKPYESLAFGVLRDCNTWEIPDIGVEPLENVTHWFKLPNFPKP